MRQEQKGRKMGMKKGQKDGNQSEMLREKSNFKRAAILFKYFRKAFTTTGSFVSVSGVGEEGSLLCKTGKKGKEPSSARQII